MRVSAKSDYALRALIEITQRWVASDPSVVSAEELSRAQGIPHGFLQGILADLRRAGVLVSQRGQSGGWRLAVDPNEISVAVIGMPCALRAAGFALGSGPARSSPARRRHPFGDGHEFSRTMPSIRLATSSQRSEIDSSSS